MYEVTEQVKNDFKSTGTVKRGYIRLIPLSNEEETIFDESSIKQFRILDDIYTPDEGVVGSVIAKELSIQLFKPSSVDLVDRELEVFIGVEDSGGNVTYVPYGTYIIQKPENETLTENASFEALDYLIKFNVPYVDNIEYPTTLKNVLKSICELSGVPLATETFANDDFVVENNQFVNAETCRDVLKGIVQQAGGYARIGRDNALHISTLGSQTMHTIDETEYSPDIKVNQVFGPVNRLVLRMSQVEGENVVREDAESIAEYGLKELVIYDNPFTYTQEKREQSIDEIWNVVNGMTYYDFETKNVPRPYADAGDNLTIEIGEDTYDTYIFTQEIIFNGGLNGTISATADTESETRYAFTPNIGTRLKRTEIVVDKHDQTITAMAQQVEDNTEQIAQQQVTINSISSSISLIGGNNKQRNSIGAYGTIDFEQNSTGSILAYEDETLKTATNNGFGRIIYITNGKWFKFKSDSLVVGDIYTLSFKYSNDANNQCTINFINNNTTTLVSTTAQKTLEVVEYTFIANTEYVELYVSTGASGRVGITDYYLQTGDVATKWQPASGETLSTTLSIYYDGIQVTSANSEIITNISNLGFSVTNTNGKILITFNKDKCILADTEIDGTLEQGTWLRYTQTINGYEHLVEVQI